MWRVVWLALLIALGGAELAPRPRRRRNWSPSCCNCSRRAIDNIGAAVAGQTAQRYCRPPIRPFRGCRPTSARPPAKDVQADVKKFYDEVEPLLRKRATELAPATLAPIYEERFNEDELKQVIAWLESPVSKKLQQVDGEISATCWRKRWWPTRARPSRPSCKTLEASLDKRLGIAPTPAAAAVPRDRRSSSRRTADQLSMADPKPTEPDLPALRQQIDAVDRELAGLAQPPRGPGAGGRRDQEARGLGGLSARARGAGHRWPEGRQPRAVADRQRGADLARNHVSLPRAWRRPRAWPTWGRPAPSANWLHWPTSARRSSACPAPASTKCFAARPVARPTSAWCRSKTRPKAWSRVRSTCSSPRRSGIIGETSLFVRHNLLRKSETLDGISAVCAHPQALAQCHGWLANHLPSVERRPVGQQRRRRAAGVARRHAGRHRQRTRGQ